MPPSSLFCRFPIGLSISGSVPLQTSRPIFGLCRTQTTRAAKVVTNPADDFPFKPLLSFRN